MFQCENWVAFIINKCANSNKLSNFNTKRFMSADEQSKANYYFQTNSKAPFNRGLEGLKYTATA